MVDAGATTTLTRPDERVPITKPSTRLRNIELGLLVVALAVSASSILLVQLGARGRIDPHLLTLAAGLGRARPHHARGAALLAHATRIRSSCRSRPR